MPRTPHSSLNAPQALAEAGAAGPVAHRGRPPGAGRRRGRGRQLAGDAREAGAERERLDPSGARPRRRARSAAGPARRAPSSPRRRAAARAGGAGSPGSRWSGRIGSPPARSGGAHRAAQVGRPRRRRDRTSRRRAARSDPARRRSAISRWASCELVVACRRRSPCGAAPRCATEAQRDGRVVARLVASASSSPSGAVVDGERDVERLRLGPASRRAAGACSQNTAKARS